MRNLINTWLATNNNVYLLHSDTWHFKAGNNVINCGITEPSMVTLAAGMAAGGATVLIYGVCGFVLYRGYDQLMYWVKDKHYKGNIIMINAGANKCYPEKLGPAHRIYNDFELANGLGLTCLEPTHNDIIPLLNRAKEQSGLKLFVRLGFDNKGTL